MSRRTRRRSERVPPLEHLSSRLARLTGWSRTVVHSRHARRALIRRAALLVVVLSVSLRTASIHAEATALRTRWTAGTPVVLANRDLERGEALTAEDTRHGGSSGPGAPRSTGADPRRSRDDGASG
ncbi:MAG: hypothetical protein R2789_00905 [Microthrixaceae bacterium]